jgi:uncharacterized protein (DUF433 family)
MPLLHVSSRPEVLAGQPCFEGTRTPVDVLFVNLAAGERLDVVLDSTPDISREAAIAVLREACRLVRERAMAEGELAPDAQAQAGEVMYPGDWDALAADERAEHYRRR